jgi:glyoxylase I family protein
MRLHHLALGARDVERVAEFYRDVLALPELDRHFGMDGRLRSVWLDLGGAILMVEKTELEPRLPTQIGVGPFLLALRVTPQQRSAVEQALLEAGAPVEGRTTFTSYSRDPEGNRIAISHHPEPPL